MKVTVEGDLSQEEAETARRKLASLQRYADEPLLGARLVLRRGPGRSKAPYVVDARVLFRGHLLVAHGAGPSPRGAVDQAVDRLRRQMRRIVEARVAKRTEPSIARP